MSITALIVDDEPYARAHIKLMVTAHGVTVVDEADNVAAALQLVEDKQPQVVFLDIQMPGLTGLQMAQAMSQMERPPLVVFVTGDSTHADEAIEFGAVGYLMKPVSEERLAAAIQRIKAALAKPKPVDESAGSQSAPEKTAQPITRLPVRVDYAVKLLRVEEIVMANAREKRVFVLTADGSESRTYYTLTQLEQMLPPERFVRIHDAYVVNVDNIEELVYLGSHTYEVKLTNGSMLPVGRRRFAELKRRLGLSEG